VRSSPSHCQTNDLNASRKKQGNNNNGRWWVDIDYHLLEISWCSDVEVHANPIIYITVRFLAFNLFQLNTCMDLNAKSMAGCWFAWTWTHSIKLSLRHHSSPPVAPLYVLLGLQLLQPTSFLGWASLQQLARIGTWSLCMAHNNHRCPTLLSGQATNCLQAFSNIFKLRFTDQPAYLCYTYRTKL
jgi:hypothetical protein